MNSYYLCYILSILSINTYAIHVNPIIYKYNIYSYNENELFYCNHQ